MKLGRGVLVAALLALTVSFAARAATVETKVRLLVRDKPTTSARIVDRVPAGKKLPVLGRSTDGGWIHVRSGGHDGWIPAESVKGGRDDDGGGGGDEDSGSDEEVKPLAKKRGVRPEAWVSKSRYHDADEKLIVSVNKAELYGRPSSSGAVLGILRRGEAVTLVTKSPDKKWLNVDIGGGSTAWIEARAVKPGRVQSETPPPDESAQAESAPPPTITPEGAKKKANKAKMTAKVETPPPEEEEPQQEEAPPPPPPKKKKKQPPAETPPEEESAPAGKASEDETPPGLAQSKPSSPPSEEEPPPEPKRKKKKKGARVASRGDEGETAAAPDPNLVRDQWTQHGKIYVLPVVRLGIGIIEQRFTSNGMGALSNYQASTGAFGAQLGIGLFGTVGKYALFGADGYYEFLGAAALRYVQPTDGSIVTLAVQTHTADVGLSAGLHFGALGGLTLRLRLGGQMILDLVQPDVRTKLPSDRILGMSIGIGAEAPALFHIARHALGVWLGGGGLVPAQRAQTLGLEDGAQSTTYGAFFGGGARFVMVNPSKKRYRGSYAIDLSYQYEFAATHYTGLSRRNDTITIADRGSAQHLIGLGLVVDY